VTRLPSDPDIAVTMFEVYCVFARLCERARLADDPGCFHVVVMPRGLSYSMKIAIGSIAWKAKLMRLRSGEALIRTGWEMKLAWLRQRVACFFNGLFCRASVVFFTD
jgi:hypothetical protein